MFKLFSKKIKSVLSLLKSSPRRYRYLFETIRDMRPKRIMEIGVWNGYRARDMLQAAQKAGVANVEYYGFDLFEGMDTDMLEKEVSKMPPSELVVEKMLASSTSADINLFKGNTLDVLPQVVSDLPQMDFVFIDGGHAVETIKNDWEHVKRLMHSQTVVVFDDYYADREDIGAKSVVDAIDRDEYVVTILPTKDSFKKEWGTLHIQFASVTRKNS